MSGSVAPSMGAATAPAAYPGARAAMGDPRMGGVQQQAARRMGNRDLSMGWSVWHEQWEEVSKQKRMLAAAGARLMKPQLTAALEAMHGATATFGAESADERPPVPERSPQPYTEPLAKTAAEERLRAHGSILGFVTIDLPNPTDAVVKARALACADELGGKRSHLLL